MKRYCNWTDSVVVVTPGNTEYFPMGIPLENKKVLDIYLIKFYTTLLGTVAGTLYFAWGLSYKRLERSEKATPAPNAIHTMTRRDAIVATTHLYQTPAEVTTEQDEWYFNPEPFTVWCSPTFYVAQFAGTATVSLTRTGCELFGKIRTPSDEEWKRLQIEQRQEKQ